MKLGYRPAKGHLLETRFLGQGQVALGLGANHNITNPGLIQIADQFSRKESRIGQQTNPGSCPPRRHLFQTAPDQRASPGVGRRLAGAQRSVPKLLPVGFKAQAGMIGGASFLLGIVTPSGAWLLAIEREDHGVEVQDQAGSRLGQGEQLRPELILQTRDLPDGLRGEAAQKPAQGRFVRKLLQAGQ